MGATSNMQRFDIPDDNKVLEPYNGYIELPLAIQGRMFAMWWEAEMDIPGKSKDSFANSKWMKEWRGALALLKGFGDIVVNGVSIGDLTPEGDNADLPLMVWIGAAVNAELLELVTLKKTVTPSLTGLMTKSGTSLEA